MDYKFMDSDDLRVLDENMQDAIRKIDSMIDSFAGFNQTEICCCLNDAKDSIQDEQSKVDQALTEANRREEQEELNAYYKQCY